MKRASNKASGCLAELAVGDALGTTLEFSRPGSFAPISDMVGGGPFRLEAGQWTDDTSMALCLAESLVERGEFDARDQAERYVRWWREGHLSSTGSCFDIGNTVSAALRRFERTGEPMSGSSDPLSSGNGSIMRLAPVPIFYDNAVEAVLFSGESSRTTHQAAACVDACRYSGGILWGLMHGAEKEEVLEPRYHPAGEEWAEMSGAAAAVADGSFKVKQPPEIRGTGYVVESQEAALWAFHLTDDFEAGALLAVNLGEDADTTGAVYGQIAGACYGIEGIPERWLEKLHERESIIEYPNRLIQ